MQSNWYAIQVRTGSEKRICEKIIQAVDGNLYQECFVPLAEYIMKREGAYEKRIRPLFPGYLFIITDCIEQVSAQLSKISAFKRVLKSDNIFTPIEQEEADLIAGLYDEAYLVRLSKGMIVNSKVIVLSGPFQGREGLIKKIDRHRRTGLVEMTMMGRSMQIQIPLEIVEKIS